MKLYSPERQQEIQYSLLDDLDINTDTEVVPIQFWEEVDQAVPAPAQPEEGSIQVVDLGENTKEERDSGPSPLDIFSLHELTLCITCCRSKSGERY